MNRTSPVEGNIYRYHGMFVRVDRFDTMNVYVTAMRKRGAEYEETASPQFTIDRRSSFEFDAKPEAAA